MSDYCRRYLVAMQKLLDIECQRCFDTYELSVKLFEHYTEITRDPYSEQGWKRSFNIFKFPNLCVKGKKQELLPRSGPSPVHAEKKDQCKHNHSGVARLLLTKLAAMPVIPLDEMSSFPCVFQLVTGSCTSPGCGYYHCPPGSPDSDSDAELTPPNMEQPPSTEPTRLEPTRPLIDLLDEGVYTSPQVTQVIQRTMEDHHTNGDWPFFQTSRRPTTHPCGVANKHFH